MPSRNSGVKVAVLAHARISLSLTLLLRDIFLAANREEGSDRYRVSFIGASAPAPLRPGPPKGRYDIVIAPPMEGFAGRLPLWKAERELLAWHGERGALLASACLGSLLLAGAGLLDGQEATTHWRWADFARRTFPQVAWREDLLLCDRGNRVTAGGYLSVVDLALHLVSRTASRTLAHTLGQALLAGSVRQKQSVYAQSLVPRPAEHPVFTRMEGWLQGRLGEAVRLEDMADFCGMSLRNFQRLFAEAYGTSPGRFLQLRRLERARELLRDPALSTEAVLERVGLSDIAAFRKVFQRELGMSPAAYRRQLLERS